MALSGAVAGIASSFLICPMEHSRIRVQTQSKGTIDHYSGSFDAAVQLTKRYGFFRGLMRGWCATLSREVPSLALYFMVYDAISNAMRARAGAQDINYLQLMMAGGITGLISGTVTFPLDSLKSIAHTQNMDSPEFKNYRDLVLTTLKKKGLRSLYSGINVVLVRAMPVNAVTFLFYESCKSYLMAKQGAMML